MPHHRKILIIRFSSIGDIVIATAPLQTIRNAFPDAEIHFLTLDRFVPLLECHPAIDRIISFDPTTGLQGLMHFKEYIRSIGYDHVYDLHNSLRSRMICHGFTVPISRVKKPRISRFLLFQFHWNTFNKDFSTSTMYHECFKDSLLLDSPLPLPRLKVDRSEKITAQKMLLSHGIDDSFIVLIPGAAWGQKQWFPERYAAVVVKLYQYTDKRVIMLGSENDSICDEIFNLNRDLIDLSGKTSLRDALSIISLADYAFGSDTGLLHAAEALGVPVSMILGPTSKETGAGVSLASSKNIASNVWCRPCSQNGKRPCYRSRQFCMDQISIENVTGSITERLLA